MKFKAGTVFFATLLLLLLIVNILRFVGLEKSPPGFYHDEVVPAVHILCLGETGHDAYGVKWPLFSTHPGAGSGVSSPVHLYFGVLWQKIFGSSIAAFRAVSAFETALTILGLFLLGSFLFGVEGGLLTALAGSLSPPGFQFSRMGFDDPTLYTLGLVFGLYFFLRGKGWKSGVTAAFFFAVAIYSYPTAKVCLAVLTLPLIYLKFKLNDLSETSDRQPPRKLYEFLLWAGGAGLLFLVPFLYKLCVGALSERSFVTIFYQPYLAENGGTGKLNIFLIFVKNFFAHFSPEFLFIHGDHILRHSTQFVGEWSWLDDGVLLSFLLLAWRWRRVFTRRDLLLFSFFTWGYIAAIIPSAMTWESIPHALRSIGLWPFLALLVGFAWAKLRAQTKLFDWLFIALATVFVVAFGLNYGGDYRKASPAWYDDFYTQAALQAAKTDNWNWFVHLSKDTPRIILRYYLISQGGYSCEGSER